jgi:hypothetical protein
VKLGRFVAVSGMTLAATVGIAVPASAASLPGPGSAAACKAAGGAVVEPHDIDKFQEAYGIDDKVDFGSCVGGANDGAPIIDPAAG